MVKKTTTPIIEVIEGKSKAIGLLVEYRMFGILMYQKKSVSPCKFGVEEYDLLNP